MPSLRSKSVRGDHYVTLVVEVPTSLNHAAKEALREYDLESGNSLNQKTENGKPKKKGFMDKIKESLED
jgi:molecular chaperone DnaJ